MTELTKLYIGDQLSRFREYGIFPFVYQPMGTLLSTIITIIIPYTPFNLLIYLVVMIFLAIFNPYNYASQIIYQCASDQLIPQYQFSFKSLIIKTYYIYFICAFLLNYDTIYHLKNMRI